MGGPPAPDVGATEPQPRLDHPLARARAITRVLDNGLRVPGTSIRFGLDPVLGLIPGLGDVAGTALGSYLVLLAARLGAPAVVVARMLMNVTLDALIGSVPLLGDAVDFVWKSNTRNLALLERFIERPGPTRNASRLAVGVAAGALILVGLGGAALAVVLVRWVVGLLP